MKTYRTLFSLILAIGLLLATVSTTLAMPPLPSSFYGSVKVNGANAPAGTIISARINAVEYAHTTVGLYQGVTVYSLEVPGDDKGTPDVIEGGKMGDSVVFYLDGAQTNQSGAWNSGSNVRHNIPAAAGTNRAPVANAQSIVSAEDSPKAITLTGTDADGDLLIYTVVASPAHGILSGSAPALTYLPTANYFGPDDFTFKVNDGMFDSALATVGITLTAVNDAPVAQPDTYNRHAGDTLNGSSVLANDTDADTGDHLTAVWVSGPAHAGGFTFNTDGTFVYTPVVGYSGTDSFTYKVNDGTVDSNVTTASIMVTAVNNAPIISEGAAIQVGMSVDRPLTPFSLTLHATDADNDTLTWSISIQAGYGVASAGGTGVSKAIVYTSAPQFIGTDSFDVQVSDGIGGSDAIRVNVTISFRTFLPLTLR